MNGFPSPRNTASHGADEGGADDWLVTYADAITLLMAFFIMLVSFSKIDIPMYEQVAAGIREEIGKRDVVTPVKLLKLDMEDAVFNMNAEDKVTVKTDDRGVLIELASSEFYLPGSAEIRPEAESILQRLAAIAATPRYRSFAVEVEGHTDDIPIRTERFPSNWELSAARATRVVRFLADQGVTPKRMKAVGFADTRPKAPNRAPDGLAIPANQAQNRRVSVHLFPMLLERVRSPAPTPRGHPVAPPTTAPGRETAGR